MLRTCVSTTNRFGKSGVAAVIGAASLLLASAPASAEWLAPTGGWEVDYQASSGMLPDNASLDYTWTRINYVSTNVFNDAVTNEQTLFMDRGGQNNPRFSSSAAWASGTADDLMTVDFRLRLIGASENNTQDTSFEDNDYQFQLFIQRPGHDDQVANGNDGQMALIRIAQNQIVLGDATMNYAIGTDWHDVRLHIDWSTGALAMFLDDESDAILTGNSTPLENTANQIAFGHASSTVRGSMNMSYLRFTNSELATVPEPGSLLLIGTGALCLLRRRQRTTV